MLDFIKKKNLWLGKFMGEKPSLSYRQSTGYHSYMFHNNIAFCRPWLFKQFYWSKTACAPLAYTRWRRTILPDQLIRQSAGGSTRRAQNSSSLLLTFRASDFPFQKNQFSVSKKVKFRFDSVSLLATLNSMKSQYIERKCGERTVKMVQLVRWTEEKGHN